MSRVHHSLILVVGSLVSSLSSSSVRAEPAAARAGEQIDRVVVFADRAEVTRRVSVACTNGTAAATFPRLPATVDTRTVRGEVDGDGAVGHSRINACCRQKSHHGHLPIRMTVTRGSDAVARAARSISPSMTQSLSPSSSMRTWRTA